MSAPSQSLFTVNTIVERHDTGITYMREVKKDAPIVGLTALVNWDLFMWRRTNDVLPVPDTTPNKQKRGNCVRSRRERIKITYIHIRKCYALFNQA